MFGDPISQENTVLAKSSNVARHACNMQCLDSKLEISRSESGDSVARTLCSDPASNTVMGSVVFESVGSQGPVRGRSGEWWDHVACRYGILLGYLQSYEYLRICLPDEKKLEFLFTDLSEK